MIRVRLLIASFVVVLTYQTASTQMLTYLRGQNVSPAFEGWEKNPDGSFNMMFGYMNRNWEEEVDVPVGVDNNISPACRTRASQRIFCHAATASCSRCACRPTGEKKS